jgi:hypothetical protein
MPDVASDVPKRVTARMPSAEAPSDGDTSDRTEQQEVTTRERVTQRMDAVEVPAHERVTQRMDAVEVPAHERVTQRMDAVEVPAHERETQRMQAVAPARDVYSDIPELEHLDAVVPEMLFGAHQQSRVVPALRALTDDDYAAFQELVAAEPNLVAQAFLFKALAAKNSLTDIRWLAGEMSGKSGNWLIDNLTLGDPRQVGGGIRQQWSMSCNASMTLTLRGNYDPVFALQLRYRNMSTGDVDVNDPDAANMYQADLEKSMLESEYGGGGWGAAGSHKGVATPIAGPDGKGRAADDLLNTLSEITGVHYSVHGVATPGHALPVLDGPSRVGSGSLGSPGSPDRRR